MATACCKPPNCPAAAASRLPARRGCRRWPNGSGGRAPTGSEYSTRVNSPRRGADAPRRVSSDTIPASDAKHGAMRTHVYERLERADTYVFLAGRDDFSRLPEPLRTQLGKLQFVLD